MPLYLVVARPGHAGVGRDQPGRDRCAVVPTLAAHWVLGRIDWDVAAAFAAGLVLAALLGSRAADRVPGGTVRTAFGVLLVDFALYFTTRQVISA